MKPILLALAAALAVATLRSEPVLEGYMITADRPQFMLSDGKGKKSGWLTLGQTFENFTLIALQPEAESLLVEKDGKRQLLKLRKGTILAPKPETIEARVRSLNGLALAYELLKYEDKLTDRQAKAATANLKAILKRYEEVLVVRQIEPPSSDKTTRQASTATSDEAANFLKTQIERFSDEAAPLILADIGKRSP